MRHSYHDFRMAGSAMVLQRKSTSVCKKVSPVHIPDHHDNKEEESSKKKAGQRKERTAAHIVLIAMVILSITVTLDHKYFSIATHNAGASEKPSTSNGPHHHPLFELDHYSSSKTYPRAPWDPAFFGRGGGEVIAQACATEINYTGCNKFLPTISCLQEELAEKGTVSPSCQKLVFPCGKGLERGDACKQFKTYSTFMNELEMRRLEELLVLIDKASSMNTDTTKHNSSMSGSLVYWMTAGSIMGSLIHHSIIPWDDDVDVYVLEEHMEPMRNNLKLLGLNTVWLAEEGFEKRALKVFNASNPKIRKRHKHTYPFIDMFIVKCDYISSRCTEINSKSKYSLSLDEVFPLKRRPFGRLSLPFPSKSELHTAKRYGETFRSLCVKGNYNHKTDQFLGRNAGITMNCSGLFLPPAMVSASAHHTSQRYPWVHDFPRITAEHFVDDASAIRLASVIFDNGNEVRRSYADGLLGLDDGVITFTLPETTVTNEARLFPFLNEERLSYLNNKAGRSASVLNLEVMPTLDNVVISNSNDNSLDTSLREKKMLRLGEWNAERGLNWDLFDMFYPNADIIILNEMDMGMARSKNIDTTKQMAKYLHMNYAYGVEFMELTNGNAAEINMTIGMDNLIGYHGNAVLSRWPIVKSEIIRLHPLYDLLYVEKNSGQARGERRLGGHMALFAQTVTDVGDILIISIRAHSGSKQKLLKDDAVRVCDTIKRWNVSNVLLGGDIANPVPLVLASNCDFFDLEKTNSQKLNERGFDPSWKVVCSEGGKSPPALARYPTRRDWILAKGPIFNIDSVETSTDTIYTYRRNEGGYECISDHALLTLSVPLFV